MGSFVLTWITAMVLVALPFWGANIPSGKRSVAVKTTAVLLVIFNLVSQSWLFRGSGTSLTPDVPQKTEQAQAVLESLQQLALLPGTLLFSAPSQWYRIISSSFVHFGWIHLLANVWFLVLFGHVLEQLLGARKLLAIMALGLILPPAIDGFFGTGISPTGGFGGVVYAVMGAYMLVFPRSRFYAAVHYDLRFWAAVLFIILPVTMVTRYAGMTLTEPVMLMGILGLFLLIQPEHARISAAASVVVLYKLLLDVLLIQPMVADVAGNSPARVFGGFFIGAAAGVYFARGRHWRTTWEDETRSLPSSSRGRSRMSLSQLEAAGRKDEDAARAFLGQRVFVGDSARATEFYRDVVLQKFPDLMLPLQEQMALARLLHFKGYEKESLHAYEILLRTKNLPQEYWAAWLKAAELVVKLEPDREADARLYLDRFEQGTELLMRDKIEAERLRSVLSPQPAPGPADDNGPEPQWEPPLPVRNLSYSDQFDRYIEASHNLKSRRIRATDEPPALDFPKIEPRTFTYENGTAVLQDKTDRQMARTPNDVPSESLMTYWKPLPCNPEKKPMPASTIERRVKNPRIAEDESKPGTYGADFRSRRTDSRKRGRLSKLEIAKSELKQNVPDAEAMPSRYGGLDEHVGAGAPAHPGFRLRGEKDASARPRQKIARRQPPEP